MTDAIFHKTVVNAAASSNNFLGLSKQERYEINSFGFFRCNHLYAVNDCDKDLWIQLNNNTNQRYRVSKQGGTAVISVDDRVYFDSVHVLETSGAAATGTIYITFGALPEK